MKKPLNFDEKIRTFGFNVSSEFIDKAINIFVEIYEAHASDVKDSSLILDDKQEYLMRMISEHPSKSEVSMAFMTLLLNLFVKSDLNLIVPKNKYPRRSLPVNINFVKDGMLTGNLILQVEDFVDVSKPKPISGSGTEIRQQDSNHGIKQNTSKMCCKNRLLKVRFSDGYSSCFGFEVEPKTLPYSFHKSDKILLSGPVSIKNGLIMLRKQNICKLSSEKLVIDFQVENMETSEKEHPVFVDLT